MPRKEFVRRGSRIFIKVILYSIACIITVVVNDIILTNLASFTSPEIMNYKVYIDGLIVLGMGYLVVNSFADATYWLLRTKAEYGTASLIRTIVRILGIGILLAVLTSVFNVNPSAALTLGSFIGMVIGFATQTILGQALAGIFIALTRPFKPGDFVNVAGQKGIVKDIHVMYTILVSEDRSIEVLIPNTTIMKSVITKTYLKN